MALTRDDAFAVGDPALNSLYVVRVPFITDTKEIVAEEIAMSFAKIPAQARFAGGSNDYYPGVKDIDGLTVTFYETQDLKVTNWLQNWRKLICDDDGNYGVPVDYKKTIVVELYTLAQNSPVQIFKYMGCWPTDHGAYSLSYNDETGRITVQAQFSVDEMKSSYNN